jgi:hypothetical protein
VVMKVPITLSRGFGSIHVTYRHASGMGKLLSFWIYDWVVKFTSIYQRMDMMYQWVIYLQTSAHMGLSS